MFLGRSKTALLPLLPEAGAEKPGRANAASAVPFSAGPYAGEVGFLHGEACYVIYRRRGGDTPTRLQNLEAIELLTREGLGAVWLATPRGAHTVDFVYCEQPEEKDAPARRVLFAQQQAEGSQLVIFTPDWQPDLPTLNAEPL